MFRSNKVKKSNDALNGLERVKALIEGVDSVVIGAGAGLSTAAGYRYSGEPFARYFTDFAGLYDFQDMYSGGFYPYDTLEEYWGYWSRYIWVNRYLDCPGDVYRNLLKLVEKKNYFVLTTNVDHCFHKAGFDKKRLFYTQGDYGLWQAGSGQPKKTYDNYHQVKQMILSQGWRIDADNDLLAPSLDGGYTKHTSAIDWSQLKLAIPSELVPYGEDGLPFAMNLRADDRFVEDAGWHDAAKRYNQFIEKHAAGPIIYLEIGVGFNTPIIIKYNFWKKVHANPQAYYICLNKAEVHIPKEIRDRSIGIAGDADVVINELVGIPKRRFLV
ncbi:Sir2 silent information regulator family NAD-dependent deacetylase [Candidatus Enterococcus moelleringii]|uniref:Sir2 silent information regulator family NAD-dependent deacetylase n=1 Tax=Candidatus Enterococcus moelleringii TaxID=2815325 RepID=UPI001F624E9F|nr:Sir2 silent information regulator family NAD-dependent deacetylase [Enterococcus sp. 669A]